ncbi:uncharacterized protein O3C94_016456 [Discoglossus pictus]
MVTLEKKLVSSQKVLNHTLEIIYLLTGEASHLKHLNKARIMIELNKDKTMIERILNHTLQIIYLLTGEEYTIVNKDPLSIQHLTGECDIDGHKEMMKNSKTLRTLKIQANRGSGLHDEKLRTSSINEEGEYKREEEDIEQVELQLDLCAGPSKLKTLVVSELDEEEMNIRDHQQVKEEKIPVTINEKSLTVKPLVVLKTEAELIDVRDQQQVKEEDIPVNISEGLQDEDLYTISVKEEEEDEVDESDILQVEVHPDLCAGNSIVKPSSVPKLEEDKNVTGQQRVKEEEIPLNISECFHAEDLHIISINKEGEYERDGKDLQQRVTRPDLSADESTSRNTPGEHCISRKSIHFVIGDRDIRESEERSIITNVKYKPGSKSIDNSEKGLNSNVEITLTESTSEQEAIVCLKEGSTETKKAMEKHKNLLIVNTNSSEYGENSLTNNTQLFTDENICTIQQIFSCSVCWKSFSQQSDLVSHERIHTCEKPFSCSECGESFRHKTSLFRHEEIHTDVKPFACAECGKCFSQKFLLLSHEKIHSSEKPFACSECGKCFRLKGDLVRHENSHKGLKPFACSDCEKCFNLKSSLISHQRIHTGEKPFKCPVCSKCFSQRSHLNNHHRIHTGEKPYVCSECGKCFRNRSHLVGHEKIHTAEK